MGLFHVLSWATAMTPIGRTLMRSCLGPGKFSTPLHKCNAGAVILEKVQSNSRTYCRFRFLMANALVRELRIRSISGHGGERVFPLFVANPITVRLFLSWAGYGDQVVKAILPPSPPASMRVWTSSAAARGKRQ